MDPGIVLGRARVALFVGLFAVVGGLTLQVSPLAWTGVALVAVAFGANVVGKVTHFRELPLSPTERTRLAATWVLLSVGVVAVTADAVARRTLEGYGGAFWPLVVVVVVLAAAYRRFQGRYLDEEMGEA